MSIEALRRRFTVEEYHRMGEAGILTEDDRVELIEGEILQMSPIGRRHAACVDRLTHLFTERLGRRAQVRVQNPVVFGRHSEPVPDIALLRPRADFYAKGHPSPEDVFLLVEVSDSTLGYDRATKVPLYAKARIEEVWIIDLAAEAVEVYLRPGQSGYRDVRTLGRADALAPHALSDCRLTVESILGAP